MNLNYLYTVIYKGTKLTPGICFALVQNCSNPLYLSSHLLSKNIKIRIYKTIILPVVLYGCETWCLTLTLCVLRGRSKGRHLTAEECEGPF
jgi:hypothetical protein